MLGGGLRPRQAQLPEPGRVSQFVFVTLNIDEEALLKSLRCGHESEISAAILASVALCDAVRLGLPGANRVNRVVPGGGGCGSNASSSSSV